MYAEKKSNTQGIVERKSEARWPRFHPEIRTISGHELELGRKKYLPGRNVRNWSWRRVKRDAVFGIAQAKAGVSFEDAAFKLSQRFRLELEPARLVLPVILRAELVVKSLPCDQA
jgi:hypothetical protein